MTCIVAIEKDGTVYMGGDSMGAAGWDMRVRTDRKVFKRGDFLIGYTTSFRMGQLLRFGLDVPKQEESEDDLEYMVVRFVEAVRALFRGNGYSKIESNVEEGGDFLVGYKGKLYQVCSDYQVKTVAEPYDSVGAGYAYALGALDNLDLSNPEDAILKALETAGKFSNGVCGPYYVEKL